MSQLLQKPYTCFGCQKEVKLQRDEAAGKWNKFNLDGTPHVHEKKAFPQSKTAERIEQLEKKVDVLIAQIQMLRSDFKELKEK